MPTTALIAAAVPFVRMAGRWILRRMVTRGIPWVICFIEGRIDTFQDRIKRARSKKRKRWLRWRIAWRRRAIAWLRRYKTKLTKRAVKALDNTIDKRIPWDAAGERFETWARSRS